MAGLASSGCTFNDKKLENVDVCNEHLTEHCYEVSYRYEIAVPSTAWFKQTIKTSSFAVIQEIPLCHRQEGISSGAGMAQW